MDIIKFNNPTSPTKMEHGEIINGLDSIMWVERHRPAGEFTFKAKASTGMRNILPIGSFVTHMDTTEIMIVENHEITEDPGKNADIVITGRGFETFLENRIVGSNQSFPVIGPLPDYSLASDFTWNQVAYLISDHILESYLLDDNNSLDWVNVVADVTGVGDAVGRIVKRGEVYTRVLELLEIDDLGIKVVRPGVWGDPENTLIVVHKGIDRTGEVIFSYDTGEIDSADYLWSNKKFKNAALVSSRWFERAILPDTTNYKYGRRMMHVDASDLDNSYSEAPTGGDMDAILLAMEFRALEALAAQNDIAFTKAEVSKNNARSRYRIDFNVGDFVTVSGDYNEVTRMRVSEYVEIEDETGRSGYPTLSVV